MHYFFKMYLAIALYVEGRFFRFRDLIIYMLSTMYMLNSYVSAKLTLEQSSFANFDFVVEWFDSSRCAKHNGTGVRKIH